MGRSQPVAEIDPVTLKMVRSFPDRRAHLGNALSPDETRLYAASGLSGTLTIVDLQRNRVTARSRLGGKPWGAVAAPR